MARQARQIDRWMREAVQFHQQGRLAEAESIYLKVQQKDKRNPDAAHLLGLVAYARQNYTQAARLVRKAIAYRPNDGEFHYNLGNIEKAAGNSAAAARAFEESLRVRPNDYRACTNLGNALLELGRADEACASYNKALTINSKDPLAHANLGRALIAKSDWQDSNEALKTAHRLAPDNIGTLVNLALVNCMLEDYTAAQSYNERALNLDERFRKARIIDGYLGMVRGETASARQQFENIAGPLNQGHDEAHEYLAQLAFNAGDFGRAFEHYESRLCPRFTDLPRLTTTPQQGQRPLIVREQGLGDEIRYARFLTFLESEDTQSSVTCDPRLTTLFQRSFPKLNVIGDRPAKRNQFPGDHTHEAAIASLGRLYHRHLTDCAAEARGYLIPDAERQAQWRLWLRQASSRPAVGLAWRGARFVSGRESWYPPLDALLDQLINLNITLVSLQHGITDQERRQFEAKGLSLLEPTDLDLRDDQDGLAALLSSLDLVLAPASAISELAAAVGSQTWVTARKDYKLWWLSEAYLTRFYPQLRLFSRDENASWDSCMATLAEALNCFVQSTEPTEHLL